MCMFHIAGDRLYVDADTRNKMNFNRLFDGLNSTENFTDNDFPTDEEDEEVEENVWYDFQITGKAYMACILFIALVGVAGNVMSFKLMMDKKLNSFAYSIYFKWMAVSDSVLLVMVSTEDSLEELSFLNIHVILCKVWMFVKNASFILSPWLVVALTLDRFVCVVFPLSRHVYCTKSKAIKLCLSLTLVAAAVNIHILIFIDILISIERECRLPDILELDRYEAFLNLVLKSTLPCVLVLVLNIVTIIRIRRSLSFRQQFTGDNISKAEKEREDKTTLPLLLVSGFAFVTLLPRSVTEVAETILQLLAPNGIAITLAGNIWPIFNVIYIMNFAQNFYILIASWPEYRMIIKNIFSRNKASLKTPTNSTNKWLRNRLLRNFRKPASLIWAMLYLWHRLKLLHVHIQNRMQSTILDWTYVQWLNLLRFVLLFRQALGITNQI